MMSDYDIAVDCRDYGRRIYHEQPDVADVLRRAADEIERLRKEVATLREIAAAEDAVFDKLVPSR